eukprot:gene46125-31346_t
MPFARGVSVAETAAPPRRAALRTAAAAAAEQSALVTELRRMAEGGAW